LLDLGADVIYGTVRLIKKEDETFLTWAKGDFACIILNLRVVHTDQGISRAKEQFQMLIGHALSYGGLYYLTYHRWARKDQLLSAYPQMPEFLKKKRQFDPEETFQNEWYRYYKGIL
jgi:FAD/FMN-containing dehydrogenase